ncbi:hypothetical protein GTG23_07045 [Rhodococcus hoagii]|nr:hypothetical protein [Prescottella equi]NKZ63091.1 hypothetical protein [Prescottella equi]NKZ64018.1 hypothetical protein [Prescottella equi]
MNQRDELAQDVAAAVFEAADTLACADIESSTDAVLVGHFDMRKAADHLIGLGYSRPRVVETVEELDTLSRGARILTPKTGNVWWPSRHGRGWDGSNGGYTFTRDLLEQEGPATVLYLPEEKP